MQVTNNPFLGALTPDRAPVPLTRSYFLSYFDPDARRTRATSLPADVAAWLRALGRPDSDLRVPAGLGARLCELGFDYDAAMWLRDGLVVGGDKLYAKARREARTWARDICRELVRDWTDVQLRLVSEPLSVTAGREPAERRLRRYLSRHRRRAWDAVIRAVRDHQYPGDAALLVRGGMTFDHRGRAVPAAGMQTVTALSRGMRELPRALPRELMGALREAFALPDAVKQGRLFYRVGVPARGSEALQAAVQSARCAVGEALYEAGLRAYHLGWVAPVVAPSARQRRHACELAWGLRQAMVSGWPLWARRELQDLTREVFAHEVRQMPLPLSARVHGVARRWVRRRHALDWEELQAVLWWAQGRAGEGMPEAPAAPVSCAPGGDQQDEVYPELAEVTARCERLQAQLAARPVPLRAVRPAAWEGDDGVLEDDGWDGEEALPDEDASAPATQAEEGYEDGMPNVGGYEEDEAEEVRQARGILDAWEDEIEGEDEGDGDAAGGV